MLPGHASVQQQGSTHSAPSKVGGNESAQLSAGPSLTHALVLQVLSEQNLAGFSGSFAGPSTAEGLDVQHLQSVCKSLKWYMTFQRKSELVNTENNNISTKFTALFACNCINAQPLINNSINTQGKVAECNTHYNLLHAITSTGS